MEKAQTVYQRRWREKLKRDEVRLRKAREYQREYQRKYVEEHREELNHKIRYRRTQALLEEDLSMIQQLSASGVVNAGVERLIELWKKKELKHRGVLAEEDKWFAENNVLRGAV